MHVFCLCLFRFGIDLVWSAQHRPKLKKLGSMTVHSELSFEYDQTTIGWCHFYAV